MASLWIDLCTKQAKVTRVFREGCAECGEAGGERTLRTDPLASGELIFISCRELSSSASSRRSVLHAKMRSQELAIGSSRGKRQGRARDHTKSAGALRAPVHENSNDFGVLCAQVYPQTGHRSSSVDFQQCRASLQPVQARQGGSASFNGRPARARQHASACEVSGGRSIAYGTRAADGVRFTYG